MAKKNAALVVQLAKFNADQLKIGSQVFKREVVDGLLDRFLLMVLAAGSESRWSPGFANCFASFLRFVDPQQIYKFLPVLKKTNLEIAKFVAERVSPHFPENTLPPNTREQAQTFAHNLQVLLLAFQLQRRFQYSSEVLENSTTSLSENTAISQLYRAYQQLNLLRFHHFLLHHLDSGGGVEQANQHLADIDWAELPVAAVFKLDWRRLLARNLDALANSDTGYSRNFASMLAVLDNISFANGFREFIDAAQQQKLMTRAFASCATLEQKIQLLFVVLSSSQFESSREWLSRYFSEKIFP